MFPSILIVDDEPSILKSLSGLLSDEGFEVATASNGYEAIQLVSSGSPDLILLDIWMPGLDGIETLTEIKKENPHIQIIIITGHGTIETAVNATKLGAFDFIEKPLSIDKVIVAINNALNFRRLEEENKYLRKKTIEKHSINGTSSAILELKKQIAAAAPSDKWIFITGENGTGKELVARSIHLLSPRVDHPLIDVNCAAIPDKFIESELFGHEKGALAAASPKKIGKFELATNGTLFFDEISDMSLRTQAILLRVLQEQQFQRIGGGRVLNVNVRVIAASNKEIETEIEKGRFRKDLYYRLNVIPIEVPPLRNRPDDIPLLVEIFLDEFSKENQRQKKRMNHDALELLVNYSWPGNVRELKNLVERLAIMIQSDAIDASDIPHPYNPGSCEGEQPSESNLFFIDRLEDAKKAFEMAFIKKKLSQNKNNLAKTAEAIDVEQSYIDEILNR